MAIVFGSIKHTYSGRKRNVQKARRPVNRFIEAAVNSEPFRRDTVEYKSADMAKARHDITTKNMSAAEKLKISNNYTIAPAYNKGAYQVISKENIKDIGK